MINPIPEDPLIHCVALFEREVDVLPLFLEAFTDRYPGAETLPEEWTVVSEPRPCAFGPVVWQRWGWQILIDLEGLPSSVADVFGQIALSPQAKDAVESHQIACMLFLTEAPETATPVELERALARAAWAMLDAGAEVLIWPRTGLGWHRDELEDIAPDKFDPAFSPV